MPSSLNSLLIAWALTLILVISGVVWIELQHTPMHTDGQTDAAPENPAAQHSGHSDDAGTDPSPGDSAAGDTSPNTETYNTATDGRAAAEESASDTNPVPESDAVTTLPRPTLDAKTTPQPENQPNNRLAPGEAAPAAASTTTPPADTLRIRAPNDGLIENSRNGPLPRIGADGTLPSDYYAAPHPGDDTRPRIAVLVSDLGAIARRTSRALDGLPNAVGLGFSPYAADLDRWTREARQKGFEYFLMVPMEPVNAAQNDPGPLGLLTDYTDRQNVNLLQAAMGQTTGYVGLVTHMGSRFTAASESLRPVLLEIQRRGLVFVDSRSTPYTRAASMAETLGMPVLQNDRYIDNDLVEAEILRQLGELENRARTLGAALGLARPYPVTIRAINSWAEGLEERGFDLVPVTALVGYQPIR